MPRIFTYTTIVVGALMIPVDLDPNRSAISTFLVFMWSGSQREDSLLCASVIIFLEDKLSAITCLKF